MRKSNFKAGCRIALSSVYIFIAVMLQTGFFSYFTLWGAIPNIALCTAVCISVFENERAGCLLALCAGFVLDSLGGGVTFSHLTFLFSACVVIVFSRRILRKGMVAAMIAMAVAILLDGGVTAGVIMLTQNNAGIISVLVHSVLPGALYTAILFFPVYLFTKLHYRIFRNKSEIN